MKKIVILSFLSGLFLVGCGSNNEKSKSADSKVEQLESRVKELESSSSSEAPNKEDEEDVLANLKSDTNRNIAKAFFDNNLPIYNDNKKGVFEAEDNTMYFSEQIDSTLYFTISHFDSLESLNNAYEEKKDGKYDFFLAKNDTILTIMTAEATPKSPDSEKNFNKYKEVFESIK